MQTRIFSSLAKMSYFLNFVRGFLGRACERFDSGIVVVSRAIDLRKRMTAS